MLDAYQYNKVSTTESALYGKVKDKEGNVLANDTFTLTLNGRDYIVAIDKYGDYYLNIESGDGEIFVNGKRFNEINLVPGERIYFGFSLLN